MIISFVFFASSTLRKSLTMNPIFEFVLLFIQNIVQFDDVDYLGFYAQMLASEWSHLFKKSSQYFLTHPPKTSEEVEILNVPEKLTSAEFSWVKESSAIQKFDVTEPSVFSWLALMDRFLYRLRFQDMDIDETLEPIHVLIPNIELPVNEIPLHLRGTENFELWIGTPYTSPNAIKLRLYQASFEISKMLGSALDMFVFIEWIQPVIHDLEYIDRMFKYGYQDVFALQAPMENYRMNYARLTGTGDKLRRKRINLLKAFDSFFRANWDQPQRLPGFKGIVDPGYAPVLFMSVPLPNDPKITKLGTIPLGNAFYVTIVKSIVDSVYVH